MSKTYIIVVFDEVPLIKTRYKKDIAIDCYKEAMLNHNECTIYLLEDSDENGVNFDLNIRDEVVDGVGKILDKYIPFGGDA